jgi:hypothetical protein
MAWRRLACLFPLLLALAVMAGVHPAAAAPLPDPAATPPVAGPIGGTPCLPVVGCDPLGGLASGAADAVTTAVFDGFNAWVAKGATAVLGHVASAMDATTKVDLNAAWFADHFGAMRGLAVLVLLPLLLIGIIDAVVRRDAGRMLRAVGVYLPVAAIGSFLAVELTNKAIQVSDAMSSQVTGDLASNSAQAIRGLVVAVEALSTPATPDVGGFLTFVVLLLVIASSFLIWIELLIRSSAIYVVVLFLPLALSGLVWPTTARWTRRLIETLVALILSKFVIVTVISLAAGALSDANPTDKLGTLMSGAALLLLAAFAPFALLKLIPMVEAGVIGHLERMERRPAVAATRATTMVAGHLIGAVGGVGAPAAAGADTENVTPRRIGGELNDVRAPGEAGGGPPRAGGPDTNRDSSPPDRPPPAPPPRPALRDEATPPGVTAGAGGRNGDGE